MSTNRARKKWLQVPSRRLSRFESNYILTINPNDMMCVYNRGYYATWMQRLCHLVTGSWIIHKSGDPELTWKPEPSESVFQRPRLKVKHTLTRSQGQSQVLVHPCESVSALREGRTSCPWKTKLRKCVYQTGRLVSLLLDLKRWI